MPDFDAAFTFVVGNEGKYSNNPADPGGETMFGVSKTYHPNVDIKNLTLAAAREIYRNEYWTPAGCDAIDDQRLAVNVLDCAINQGITPAVKWYASAKSQPVPLAAFTALRILSYTASPAWPNFGRGWMRRIARGLQA